MTKIIKYGVTMLLAGCSLAAYAVPVLQVGAFAGSGDTGVYADYQSNLADPTEEQTALTSGDTILFAGAYGPNTLSLGSETNYSSVDDRLVEFDGHNAIVMATVQDGMIVEAFNSLTVGGNSAFFASRTLSGLFPDSHAPLKDAESDFLFFDIGIFSNSTLMPDFADETQSNQLGEIKALTIAGMDNLDWIHFDLMALEVTENGPNIRTNWESNPGSHDVTWKPTVTVPDEPTITVPEPSVLALLGLGLLGLGFSRGRTLHS